VAAHKARAGKSIGAERMELAKMIGITPPEFTLSGRGVDWPPISRRPTIRLAYCTGIRRSERSTLDDERHHRDHAPDQQRQRGNGESAKACVFAFSIRSAMPRGRPSTMPAKISRTHRVAHAAVGDLLAQPHDERGAGGSG